MAFVGRRVRRRAPVSAIQIWHVQGIAATREQPFDINLPVEAHDESSALARCAELLRERAMHPVALRAHRCADFEEGFARWVANVFEIVRAESRAKRGA